MLRLRSLAATLAAVAPLAAFACSSSDTPVTPAGDASADAAATPDVVPAADEAVMSGRIVTAQQLTAVEGATLSIDGKTQKTNAEGKYAIAVPKTSPFRLRVTAEEHYTLLEQEMSVGGRATYDRGDTQLLSRTTANLLVAFLDGYDKTKGLVAVRVWPRPPCASEEGATVTLDPPGAAKFKYVENSVPRAGKASVKAGESISIVFYNVEPGTKVRPVVTHPTCETLPFPVDLGDVTYTSDTHTAEAGEVLAFLRAYVGPPKAADAGAD